MLKNKVEFKDKEICFSNELTKKIIEYIYKKYKDELEFLWEKFPNYAVFRQKSSNKWYALLLVLQKRKLGIDNDENVDVLNLRFDPKIVEIIVDNKKFFPGYHMNKKHWCSICLDNSVSFEEICKYIDDSYKIAK